MASLTIDRRIRELMRVLYVDTPVGLKFQWLLKSKGRILKGPRNSKNAYIQVIKATGRYIYKKSIDGTNAHPGLITGNKLKTMEVLVGLPEPGVKLMKTLLPKNVWIRMLLARIHEIDPSAKYVKTGVEKAMPLMNVTRGVTDWTTPRGYKVIGNARKDPESRVEVNSNAAMQNEALTVFMRDHSMRAPSIPPGFAIGIPLPGNGAVFGTTNLGHADRPRALFRGVHGPVVKPFKNSGKIDWKSFVATSTRPEVVSKGPFSRDKGIMMQIDIETIPAGTPWIWYKPTGTAKLSRAHGTVSSTISTEDEVLLPPGKLVFIPSSWPYPEVEKSGDFPKGPRGLSAVLRHVRAKESAFTMEYAKSVTYEKITSFPHRGGTKAFEKMTTEKQEKAVSSAAVRVVSVRGQNFASIDMREATTRSTTESALLKAMFLIGKLPEEVTRIVTPLAKSRMYDLLYTYYQVSRNGSRRKFTFSRIPTYKPFPKQTSKKVKGFYPTLYVPDQSATSLVTKKPIVRALDPKLNSTTPNHRNWMSPGMRNTWNSMMDTPDVPKPVVKAAAKAAVSFRVNARAMALMNKYHTVAKTKKPKKRKLASLLAGNPGDGLTTSDRRVRRDRARVPGVQKARRDRE